MKTNWVQRIMIGILVLVIFIYVGFQVYTRMMNSSTTEEAYFYTVTESTKVSGIALRKEELLNEYVGDGVAAYTVNDGTKVSKGTEIAEIYQSTQDAENLYKIRELSGRIEQLKKAQDPGTASFAHTDVLNKQIFGEVNNVIEAVNSTEVVDLQAISDKLLLLMNTKQVATGKQTDFNTAINEMTAQVEYYTSNVKGKTSQITAPYPGYFIRKIDGFESIYDVAKISELTPDELSGILMRPTENDSLFVGKLMTSHVWYYATLISMDNLEPYRIGRSVTLDFDVSGLEPVPAKILSVNEDPKKNTAVVVFECDYINEALVNLRMAQAEVRFKSVTGLRVSNSSLRFNDIQQGVYVVRGDNIVFRPVEIAYSGADFSLCKAVDPESPDYENSLQQYDDVVIEGMQLYDGKQVK